MILGSRRRYLPVHPCAYRELELANEAEIYVNGSSLCIQGTQDLGDLDRLNNRFIPVHTGNSLEDVI